jgi:flagellar hook assembly protein FlgD
VTPVPVSVISQSEIPEIFGLKQNYPNPFNPVTTIKFSVSYESNISLRIYDVNGSLVSELYSGYISAGIHGFEWNAENFASGIYFYTLESNIFNETKKMLLIK